MNPPLNVGLVGFGMASQVFHAPLIHSHPDLRLTHIVERSGNEAGKKYPDAKVVRDVDTVLRDASVRLIVVATPNTSHFDIAASSLRAGKHVVVDKPVTTTSADADALIDLGRKANCILSVFQNRRWDGDFLTVRKILREGILGRLAEFESRFDRFRPSVNPKKWREQALAGSGVLFDLGSHLIDQAFVLFGKPAAIYAEIRRQRDGAAAPDSFEVHLEYAQVKVVLKAGTLVCEPSPRFVLYGTQGSYVKFGLDPQEDALKQGGIPSQPSWGTEQDDAWGTLARCHGSLQRVKYPTLAGCYPEYYTNVVRAIRGQEELVVKAEQARDVIRLIELAEQSSAQRRALPISDR